MTDVVSSTPTNSDSVELLVLSFCLVELEIGKPRPMVSPAPVWSHTLGLTANDPSTHHFEIPVPQALRISGNFPVPLKWCMRWTSLHLLKSQWHHTTDLAHSVCPGTTHCLTRFSQLCAGRSAFPQHFPLLTPAHTQPLAWQHAAPTGRQKPASCRTGSATATGNRFTTGLLSQPTNDWDKPHSLTSTVSINPQNTQ
jgi:hypothetical protein